MNISAKLSALANNMPGKAKIKIFVSHRIDMDAETIDNPLYVNVRCGAFFDDRLTDLPGDDSGENISEMRATLNEFTVQYWAWKNCEADYYGLCHYRRYLSFSETRYPTNEFNQIPVKTLDRNVQAEHGLLDPGAMRDTIRKYDLLVSEAASVSTYPPGRPGMKPQNVRELWESNYNVRIEPGILDTVLELIEKTSPQYSKSAKEYLGGKWHRGYNCYIMRKELFDRLCLFQFPIIFKIEEQIRDKKYTGQMSRTAALMGELLYGIFVYHIIAEGGWRVKELQMLRIIHPEKVPKQPLKAATYSEVKKLLMNVLPSYRVALRNERWLAGSDQRLIGLDQRLAGSDQRLAGLDQRLAGAEKRLVRLEENSKQIKRVADILAVFHGANTVRSSLNNLNSFGTACFAQELHDTHVASFGEFKNCHRGRNVVIVASGQTMKYYHQLKGLPHIGMNSSFKNENVKLDYYFTTDYSQKCDWFYELKNYDFVKFFGQYSPGSFREMYQVPEYLIEENHGRRFYQGAPSEEIHLNIEYHPLMGFYSIAFQAIHFALYTRPKRILLVGCDCAATGYFDGTAQLEKNVKIGFEPWVTGYSKLKQFVDHFYPDLEIVSVNPIGLKGLFRDIYTQEYLDDHPEIDPSGCEIMDPSEFEENL